MVGDDLRRTVRDRLTGRVKKETRGASAVTEGHPANLQPESGAHPNIPGSAYAPGGMTPQQRGRGFHMGSKVLGVGWAKTGTTTLGRCLQLLGYRHRDGMLSLAEHLADGDLSPIMAIAEEYDSFEDWPWLLLYEEFDRAFPGTRFVLTTRDRTGWLASYRNMLRTQGDASAQMNRTRSILYGLDFPNVTDQQLLDRLDAHEAAVRSYFADRPDDLLVVDWARGDGWEQLCGFLGHEVPDLPFPHANRGTYDAGDSPSTAARAAAVAPAARSAGPAATTAKGAPLRRLILHAGLPKCATTVLQRSVFNHLQDTTLVYKNLGDDHEQLIRLLWRRLREGVPAESGEPTLLEAIGAVADTDTVLISDENLSMSSMDVWHGTGADPATFARRVREALPDSVDVEVVLSIRSQDTWLVSRYVQSAPNLKKPGQADMEGRIAELLDGAPSPSLRWLEYDHVVAAIEAELGEGSVHLVAQERLEFDPATIVDRLSALLGEDLTTPYLAEVEQAGRHPRRNVRRRADNAWLVRGTDDQYVTLEPATSAAVLERFAAANQRLDRELAAVSRLAAADRAVRKQLEVRLEELEETCATQESELARVRRRHERLRSRRSVRAALRVADTAGAARRKLRR